MMSGRLSANSVVRRRDLCNNQEYGSEIRGIVTTGTDEQSANWWPPL